VTALRFTEEARVIVRIGRSFVVMERVYLISETLNWLRLIFFSDQHGLILLGPTSMRPHRDGVWMNIILRAEELVASIRAPSQPSPYLLQADEMHQSKNEADR